MNSLAQKRIKSAASAADLKSLTCWLQNLVQGLQIESGTGGADLTFANLRPGIGRRTSNPKLHQNQYLASAPLIPTFANECAGI
jgi:hypothetical protein